MTLLFIQGQDLAGVLFGIVVLILIFLAIREVVCWYNKVNLRLEKQDEIIRLLKAIHVEVSSTPADKTSEDEENQV